MEWQPIETAPPNTDLLVYVAYNTGPDEYEHEIWADWFHVEDGDRKWFSFPQLIHIPFPPTYWMPLPEPPKE